MITDQYEEGHTAYRNGKLLEDCPYLPDTLEANEWEDGWLGASIIGIVDELEFA